MAKDKFVRFTGGLSGADTIAIAPYGRLDRGAVLMVDAETAARMAAEHQTGRLDEDRKPVMGQDFEIIDQPSEGSRVHTRWGAGTLKSLREGGIAVPDPVEEAPRAAEPKPEAKADSKKQDEPAKEDK